MPSPTEVVHLSELFSSNINGSSHDNLMTIDPKDVVCGIASVVHVQLVRLDTTPTGDEDVSCDKGREQKNSGYYLTAISYFILFPYHIYI